MKKVNSPKLEQEIDQIFSKYKPNKKGSVLIDIQMKNYYVKMEIRLIPKKIEVIIPKIADDEITKDFVSYERKTLKDGMSLEGRLRNSARAQPEERDFLRSHLGKEKHDLYLAKQKDMIAHPEEYDLQRLEDDEGFQEFHILHKF